MWRTRRSELLSSVLGANNAFPTTVRLSQLETLRTTNDPLQLDQIERFCRRIGDNPPYEVQQRVGDCAETVPLAVMANVPGGGTVDTISVLTKVVEGIRPLMYLRELKTRVIAYAPCLNCRFAFARAEVSGTMVLEVGDIEPCVHGYNAWTVNNIVGPFGKPVKGPTTGEWASASSDPGEPATRRACNIKPIDDCGLHCVPDISSATVDDVYRPFGQPLKARPPANRRLHPAISASRPPSERAISSPMMIVDFIRDRAEAEDGAHEKRPPQSPRPVVTRLQPRRLPGLPLPRALLPAARRDRLAKVHSPQATLILRQQY
jgi:hypothetical protein